jgi:Zn-dependent peptidase ImmA (M78 family)/transcriptional regulator with XRE-family HTH domain
MAGLSLRELSDRLEGAVSHAALAKYEKGEMMPNSTLVTELARLLQQPVDFFFRPPQLEFQSVRFRKMVRLARRAEDSLREQALDYFERYAQIEAVLGVAKPFKNPLASPTVSVPEEAAAKADELRKAWHLGSDPIPDVIELLENKGIKIQEARTDDRHFDGLCASTEAGPVIVIASWLNENLLRKRMTTIHELAHVLLKMPDGVEPKIEERLVGRFAGAFLLPAETFREGFGHSRKAITLHELIQLKLHFGVSITAIIMRASQLGLITDATAKRFWSGWGAEWRKARKEPGDELYCGREKPARFPQLVHRAAAEEMISLSKGAALLGQRLGEFRAELQQSCR